MALIGLLIGLVAGTIGLAAGLVGGFIGIVAGLVGGLIGLLPVAIPLLLIGVGIVWLVKGSNNNYAPVQANSAAPARATDAHLR